MLHDAPAAVRERPILFSAPMVRAILAGTKTQTRRIVKPQDAVDATDDGEVIHLHGDRCGGYCDFACGELPCPYGRAGDRLWVRETWLDSFARTPNSNGCTYLADYGFRRDLIGGAEARATWRWKPSIHMPRWASRLSLEITDVRVERLQDISEDDARAEGVHADPPLYLSARGAFSALWESINGLRSWDANPWVWALTFKRVTPAPPDRQEKRT